ncbi:MAG: hypothetical protein JO102_01725, partial [Elusimicrobia bacterium]|nr:hypothetical protein [Elusimicrobiota bacterium]
WSDGVATRDGEGVAGAAAPERLIIYSTELGLRGFSFNAHEKSNQRVNAVFMGMETMSSESRMQAWKRVDRTRRDAVRVELVETDVLKNRVRHAQELDGAMKTRFGRPDGLFFRPADSAYREMIGRNVDEMSMDDLVQLASKLSSLENLGQSAMFFINEQIESKLLKEPLTAWKASEAASGNTAGRDALAALQVEILEHSDRREHKAGTEMRDPRRQALEAYRSATANVIARLTQVAKNEKVSQHIRVQAMERIADIIAWERGLTERLFTTDPDGGHGAERYQSAAFVGVAADSRHSPARTVADTVVRLADLLLPTTRTSREAAGPKGGKTTVDATAGPESGPAGGGGAAAGAAGPRDRAEALKRPATYREQAASAAGIALDGMTDEEKSKLRAQAGIPPTAGQTDAQLAAALVDVWVNHGGTEENFDMRAFRQALANLDALAGPGNFTPADAVRIAASGNASEETLRFVASRPGDGYLQLWARGLVEQIDGRRDMTARGQTAASGSWMRTGWQYASLIGGSIWESVASRFRQPERLSDLVQGIANPVRRADVARAALDIVAGLPPSLSPSTPSLTRPQADRARSMLDRILATAGATDGGADLLGRVSLKDIMTAASSETPEQAFQDLMAGRSQQTPGWLKATQAAVGIGGALVMASFLGVSGGGLALALLGAAASVLMPLMSKENPESWKGRLTAIAPLALALGAALLVPQLAVGSWLATNLTPIVLNLIPAAIGGGVSYATGAIGRFVRS